MKQLDFGGKSDHITLGVWFSSSDCVPSIQAIPPQAVTAPAASVASPVADHIGLQVGSSDVQTTEFGARPLRFIYTAESQNALAAEHCQYSR